MAPGMSAAQPFVEGINWVSNPIGLTVAGLLFSSSAKSRRPVTACAALHRYCLSSCGSPPQAGRACDNAEVPPHAHTLHGWLGWLQATALARAMVTKYGMSDKIGQVRPPARPLACMDAWMLQGPPTCMQPLTMQALMPPVRAVPHHAIMVMMMMARHAHRSCAFPCDASMITHMRGLLK